MKKLCLISLVLIGAFVLLACTPMNDAHAGSAPAHDIGVVAQHWTDAPGK